MPALIAFDLDDTLYKERTYVDSGMRAVVDAISADTGLNPQELMAIVESAPSGEAAFDALAAHLAGTPAGTAFPLWRMVTAYRNHKPHIQASARVHDVLDALRARGHRLALITDGNTVRQHAKIRALGLDRHFAPADIIVSEDLGSDKTTPVPFAAAEAMAPAMRRVYVGDNAAKDFYWPNLRGWYTVMLRDTAALNIHPQQPAAQAARRPALTVRSLEALLSLTF